MKSWFSESFFRKWMKHFRKNLPNTFPHLINEIKENLLLPQVILWLVDKWIICKGMKFKIKPKKIPP